MSKTLLKKNCNFPTSSRAFENTVRRGQAMLTPPDPMNEKNSMTMYTHQYVLLEFIHMTKALQEDVINLQEE